MMLLTNENLLTLPVAARTVQRNGRSVAASTLYRWAHKGFKGIRLEVIQAGGLMCTSEAALKRFFERLTAKREGGPDPLPEHQARQELIRRGLDELLGPNRRSA